MADAKQQDGSFGMALSIFGIMIIFFQMQSK
jgi:hypothetical protein